MPAQHRLLPQHERVPDDYRPVITRRCESLSIRREGHRRDPVCVIIEGRQPFAPREVPDDHLLVFADRYQQTAIRRKDRAAHGCRVPIAHSLTDDAYTSSNKANKNFGSDQSVQITGATNRGFVKFKLTPSLPPNTIGTHVGKATLKLFIDNVATPGTF